MLLRRFLLAFSLGLYLAFAFFAPATPRADVPARRPLLPRLLSSAVRLGDPFEGEFGNLYYGIVDGPMPSRIRSEHVHGEVEQIGSTLHLKLENVRLYGEWGGAYAGAPNRIATFNRRFQNFLATILLGLKERLREDSSLETVEIHAYWVQSKDTVEMLRSMGFAKESSRTKRIGGSGFVTTGLLAWGSVCELQSKSLTAVPLIVGTVLTGWVAWLMWTSPAHGNFRLELARADLGL